ncbi:PRP38 pre-mRNA processing factor 38 domain-containing protein B [Batrachochytrium dendrobatidis]|nr:PRP38 pre-mRNA processing factor 38 domain-containing protein B [Batrachochytrium dendrobatidis]KAK5670345.1 PRP38 pre-mRNA processing factor 38 domain-containing protein B [Batrachochytrium dendrobatidis]
MSKRIEIWGNKETMNIHNILYLNIMSSRYFKSLYEKKTYHEVIDEIYYNVSSLEPFFKGTNATSAFCLLYKLFTLKLTEKQLEGLLDHPDSPHIRALGFLYLRYAGQPSQIWDWFEPYLDDTEELPVRGGPHPKTMTIGTFCKALLTEQKWFETMLPRIPIPIAREIEQKLKDRENCKTGPPADVERMSRDNDRTVSRRSVSPPPRRRSRESSREPSSSRRFSKDRYRHSRARSPVDRRRRSRSRSPIDRHRFDRDDSHSKRDHDRSRHRSHSRSPRRSHDDHYSDTFGSSREKSPHQDSRSSAQERLAALKDRYGDSSDSIKKK